MSIDIQRYLGVNAFARATPWLHTVLAAYALWVDGRWFDARRRANAPHAAATTVLTGVAAVVAVPVNQQLISPAIARPRPCHVLRARAEPSPATITTRQG